MNWEVRTMRSVKSWFNPTLFGKNFARFWPVWGLYLVIWVFILPVNLLLNDFNGMGIARVEVLESISPLGLWIGVVFALLAGTAVYAYLCNNRSVGLLHSLPIRREGLFLTSCLSGLGFMILPNLVVFLLMLLAEAAVGAVYVAPLVMWFFAVSLMELFFFSLVSLCAMCTGHVLGIPGLYIIANCLVISLFSLVNTILSQLLYGYVYSESLSVLVKWLTPTIKIMESVEVRTKYSETGELLSAQFAGLGYILVYVIVGLIFTAIALALYRRRQLERAGDVITVAWLRPVFRYGVALFFALGLGLFLYFIFEELFDSSALPLLLFMLICGAIGYFVAEMLLQKSFWVFRRWKGCVIFLGVLAVLTCAIELDWLGIEGRVPSQDNVASVEITGMYSYPSDSARYAKISSEDSQVIQAVLALHQTIVDNRHQLERTVETYWEDYWGVYEDYYADIDWGMYYDLYSVSDLTSFDVTYHLESGGILRRSYTLPVYASDLEDPNSITSQLNTLLSLVSAQSYGLDAYSFAQLWDVEVHSIYGGEAIYYDEEGWGYYEEVYVPIDASVWAELYQAVLADLADGSLGTRYMLQNEEAMSSYYDLELNLVFQVPDRDDAESMDYVDVTIALQPTAKRTMAILENLGIFDSQITLRTYGDALRAEYEIEGNGD